MSDDNRVDVAIVVNSDGAAQGAAKASDSIARAVNGIAQDLRELVAQSRATNAALVAGFTGVATSIDGMAGRMRSAVQQTTGVVDDYGNVVVATAARVQQANNQIVASQNHVAHSSVAARREMLVLAHELMMGNYKRFVGSLMVLGEQMDWMKAIMSPAGAAIGVVVAAIGAAAAAAIHGASQMSHLRDELILTGNYAGLTADRFMAMSDQIAAASGSKITAARDALQAVAATGRFTGPALQPVAEAIAKIGMFSSAAAEEVVKSFEKMDDGVYKWAMEYNKSYHFANMAQLEHIRMLEEQGDKERAEAETAQLVIAKINETATQLGYLPGLAHAARNAFAEMWDAAMNWGRPVTIEDQIRHLTSQITSGIADVSGVDPLSAGEGALSPNETPDDIAAKRLRRRQLQQQRDLKESAAAATAESEALQLKGSEAVRTLRAEWKGLGGDVKLANDEIARFRRTIDDAKAAAKDSGGQIPEDVQRMIARQPQIEAEIRKKYDSHDFKKSPGQVTVGHDYSFENAQTQARLNALREDLKAEQAELDRAYKQQQVSLEGYYQQRLTITLRGMDAERDALKQQLDQTKALEARANTPAERLSMRTKEVEIEGRLTVMERQRAAAVTQSSQEMRAAINAETKALEDLAAKRSASEASEAQRRATIVAEEEVRQGRMTQAQLLQMQQQFEEQKTELEVQALQRRLDTERSLTISQRQAIEDQIRAVRDQSETRQLQLSVQASDQETQYARQAADSIEQGFGRAFASFADRSQSATQAFGNFITSIDQMLTQLVAKKLFQQLFEMPILGGDSATSGLMGVLTSLLGGAGAGFSAAGAFGFSSDVAASAGAVASGAMASGSEGLSSLMGLASFDVGTPFVPNDMIAQIHRGEAIVPAHMNSPYAPGNVSVSNQFVLPGGTDLRTQSQIAAMAGASISHAMRRNG
ncbi:hypothetical protein WT01_15600 [Burkholderia cepacia]|uniref:phage tail length tape measure family protein n=1 Tax=Burkholderia cepacia TaxID=292 RepID=UPI00075A016E|nr:phage tail length tape measure family protein [Burkholderia cepacia]KVL59255.1 hypothetical protein WT01_15600 [Burkholderia cepacia]